MASKPFASGHLLAAADVNDLCGVYARSTSTVDVVSSAAFTPLFEHAIGANHMSTDRMLRGTVMGDYLNNTGSGQNLTIAVYLAGVVLWWQDITTTPITASAARLPFLCTFHIANLGSASVQNITGTFWLGEGTSGTGIGDIDSSLRRTVFGGTGAWDTTAGGTVGCAAQHGASNANLSIRKKYAMLELL